MDVDVTDNKIYVIVGMKEAPMTCPVTQLMEVDKPLVVKFDQVIDKDESLAVKFDQVIEKEEGGEGGTNPGGETDTMSQCTLDDEEQWFILDSRMSDKLVIAYYKGDD